MGIQNIITNVIKKFAELEENWDSYGALPITPEAIDKAIQLLEIIAEKHPHAPLPFICPGNGGDTSFEWNTCSSRLSHWNTNKGEYIYCIVDTTVDKDKREFNAKKIIGMDKMIEIFDDWIIQ